jgi:hypothetical protein
LIESEWVFACEQSGGWCNEFLLLKNISKKKKLLFFYFNRFLEIIKIKKTWNNFGRVHEIIMFVSHLKNHKIFLQQKIVPFVVIMC